MADGEFLTAFRIRRIALLTQTVGIVFTYRYLVVMQMEYFVHDLPLAINF